MKEQTQLFRSSDIIPVLQVTVICLRGPSRRGLQHMENERPGNCVGCISVELQALSLLIKQSSLLDNIIELCV